jgi:pimeloyl-ACP methyl ester carboxylesterase
VTGSAAGTTGTERAPIPGGKTHWTTTADGVRLHALHLPGPAEPARPARPGPRTAVVVAHGFGGGLHRPPLQRVLAGLQRGAGVVAADLRGHGRSGGGCTAGEREAFDVDALVGLARAEGYDRVVTLGFSMGGSSVLRHAGLFGGLLLGLPLEHAPDAVIAVSATSRWFVTDTPGMRRVTWLLTSAAGRRVARLALGVRVDPAGWRDVPASPVDVIGAIPPLPLLLVHGERDPYFTQEHPLALAAAAGPGAATLWLEPGMGHAENAVALPLLGRLARAVGDLAGRAAPQAATGAQA